MTTELTALTDRFGAYSGAEANGKALPVESWNPPFCGDIDMRIARDGTWFHDGAPIRRVALVQLFARILRKEASGYFLVTPVEKVGIAVEDVPFTAVEMVHADGCLTFRTNVGDIVTADAGHPMRFETGDDGFKPYICVRNGLEARLSRSLAQDLVALAEVADRAGDSWLGVRSAGIFFAITPAGDTLDDSTVS